MARASIRALPLPLPMQLYVFGTERRLLPLGAPVPVMGSGTDLPGALFHQAGAGPVHYGLLSRGGCVHLQDTAA